MSVVESGAKLELRIRGIVVAYANNVQYSVQYNTEEIRGIDQLQVTEYAELHQTVNFSCSMFRVAYQAAISLGFMPKLNALLQQPLLTATIRSSVSNQTLFNMSGIKCTGRTGQVNARGIWEESLTFVGTAFSDEAS